MRCMFIHALLSYHHVEHGLSAGCADSSDSEDTGVCLTTVAMALFDDPPAQMSHFKASEISSMPSIKTKSGASRPSKLKRLIFVDLENVQLAAFYKPGQRERVVGFLSEDNTTVKRAAADFEVWSIPNVRGEEQNSIKGSVPGPKKKPHLADVAMTWWASRYFLACPVLADDLEVVIVTKDAFGDALARLIKVMYPTFTVRRVESVDAIQAPAAPSAPLDRA